MFKVRRKKLDSRLRYQQTHFTRKLDQARHYKRPVVARTMVSEQNFLTRLGLKTMRAQIIFGVILLALIYLLFIPNFLFVKTVVVRGGNDDQIRRVQSDVESYFAHAPFYSLQRNLIFTSSAKIKSALAINPQIYRITRVKKSLLHHSVTIDFQPKREQYLVNRADNFYTVYNDGIVEGNQTVDPAGWLNAFAGTLKIKDGTTPPLSVGDHYVEGGLMDQLNYIQQQFTATVTKPLDYVEIPQPLSPDDQTLPLHPVNLYIYARKDIPNYKGAYPDFRVIVAADQDLADVFAKLQLLLSQTAPDRYAKLVYVDMRFENKGFLCLSDAACAQESAPVIVKTPEVGTSTATATATIPKGQ